EPPLPRARGPRPHRAREGLRRVGPRSPPHRSEVFVGGTLVAYPGPRRDRRTAPHYAGRSAHPRAAERHRLVLFGPPPPRVRGRLAAGLLPRPHRGGSRIRARPAGREPPSRHHFPRTPSGARWTSDHPG